MHARGERGGFRPFDLLFRGNGNHEIVELCVASFGELLYILRAD